jgi:hypothetical protein
MPPTSTTVSTPTPTPPPATTAGEPRSSLQWGLIGDLTSHTTQELAVGITTKIVRVSWKDFETTDGTFSQSYLASKLVEINLLRSQGMKVILDLGLQDSPSWIHNYPNSYLVDQYGEEWTTAIDPQHVGVDESDANLIFNPALRQIAARYIEEVATTLGPLAEAIRVGGGRFGELSYPVTRTVAHTNTYWAYDALAQQQCPVPGWKPGDPSPNGQAAKFLNWYLQELVDYQSWQISTLRESYAGNIIVLYPGWGIRPGQASGAAADNLDGATSVEINGETQMGHDFAAQVAAIDRPDVSVETTWLDAQYGDDDSANPVLWNPVHYLASLAADSPMHPQVWGENTGQGSTADMLFTREQAERYNLAGVVWYDETELFSGGYAGLSDFAATIGAGSW